MDELRIYDNIVEELATAKINERLLTALVDTILDNSRLNYGGEALVLEADAPVLLIIKTFFADEYENRKKELKSEREKSEGLTNG